MVRLVHIGLQPFDFVDGAGTRSVVPGQTFEVDERTARVLLLVARGVEMAPPEAPAEEAVPTIIIPAGARTA